MTDYTEQIVAACEDALQRFPDMPEPLRDGMLDFILTGALCNTNGACASIYNEDAMTRLDISRRGALLRAMPTLCPLDQSWRGHLEHYYRYVEQYEQLKNTENA